MNPKVRNRILNLDIKINLGDVLFDVLTISYEPPVPGWHYETHFHSSFELHIITEGQGTLIVNSEVHEITAGTMYLIGPGIHHQQTADKNDPMCEYCINFELIKSKRKHSDFDDYAKREVDDLANVLLNTCFWFGKDRFQISRFIEEAIREAEQNYIGSYLVLQSLFIQVIFGMIRNFQTDAGSNYSLPHKDLNDLRRSIVDRFFRVRDAMPNSPKKLADEIGVSVRQLNRILLEYYSMTFKEKLNHFRIEYAKDQLIFTDTPIGEISERLGFCNVGYFSKVFKSAMSVTPSDFRSINKNKSKNAKGASHIITP